MSDLASLKERIAAVHQTVQEIVNKNIAARAVLDASNAELAEAEGLAGGVSPEAARFLAAYRSPIIENPAPLAPEVPMPEVITVPPITEEPTVFTDAGEPAITPDNTSGGFVGDHVAPDTPLAEVPAFDPDAMARAAEEAVAAGGTSGQ